MELPNTLINDDCLVAMQQIPSGSIDMILCDLPYGVTKCKWDVVIPFDALWAAYKRVIKPNGAIVLTATQPFTSLLISSNLADYRYNWIWQKTKASGFFNAKRQPLHNYEDVCVFYSEPPTYNPQGTQPCAINKRGEQWNAGSIYGTNPKMRDYVQTVQNYPKQIIQVGSEGKILHPTQKPVALMEYLIRTYTNEGEVVLDNCMGSGTTGIACKNTGRKFIGIERDEGYFEIAKSRLNI